MSGSTFGTLFKITTWGESHGPAVGVVVDGCPAGLPLSEEDVQRDLDRRRPGQSRATTERKEEDRVKILSGLFEGVTTGTPISMTVQNKDAKSSAYDAIKDTPRPGHADYTYQAKYGLRDHRGGGRASARETVGRVAAGAVARKLLEHEGIFVAGYVTEIGGIRAEMHEGPGLREIRDCSEKSPVRVPDPQASAKIMEVLATARTEGESLGGVVEVVAEGVPAGLGEPVFEKIDADLAKALMSIGAVKAVEIGAGFSSSRMKGSEINDPISLRDGQVSFGDNCAGGILGGITTGAPIVCRAAFKPTPSIARKQKTFNLCTGEECDIEVRGRHDPTIPPRAVPVAEAMVALVIADHLLRSRASRV